MPSKNEWEELTGAFQAVISAEVEDDDDFDDDMDWDEDEDDDDDDEDDTEYLEEIHPLRETGLSTPVDFGYSFPFSLE